MFVSYGSIIFGFILGLIIGSQLKTSNIKDGNFTASSYIVIIIAALLVAWLLGEFPFYTYIPISSAFVSALVGLLLSKFIIAGRS